jgi:hypothetical protein
MIGGSVVGVSRKDGVALLNVENKSPYSGSCAVRCIEKRLDTGDRIAIMPGDQVWWQGGKVYWSAGGVADRDVPLQKVGYSH